MADVASRKAAPAHKEVANPREGASTVETAGSSSPGIVRSQSGSRKASADPAKKSKAELKAERRAKQEKQRAAKGQAKDGSAEKKETSGVLPKLRVPSNIQVDDKKQQAKVAKKLAKLHAPPRTEVARQVGMFSHLHQFRREDSLTSHLSFNSDGIHPAILKLGLQYADGLICGSNSRCIAMLSAFKQVFQDYSTPPQKDLARDLEVKIKPYISFLSQCRPLSVSMGNAIKYIKLRIATIPPEKPENEAKDELCDAIETYLRENIILADQAISLTYAQKKINDGDVILTYACSSIVLRVLKDAHDSGKKIRVIVVDGRPKMEGKECVRRLARHGIPCTYVLINAVSYIMKEVSKVILGAHALLANGYVLSRVGTSLVAMVASSSNVPVLVCCETYKFCDRVQTDSFVFNELGDPDDLKCQRNGGDVLDGWKDVAPLGLLNLIYDVTPPDFVTTVITEGLVAQT
ncbi:translation initiation factor eIF2B subunit delta-like isoform X2 [Oscarella lobularis]|uniref:translation initiation factor eIF2B subunit delta-like isoform X2 n=1 Tax=Oscarella lobularis TaxID=121494 RepID=UPI003313F1B7